MKKIAKDIIMYREGKIQKWVVTSSENDEEVMMGLLTNPNVDRNNIIVVPVCGMMLGAIWLIPDTHKSSRFSFYDFFDEFGSQPKIKVTTEIKETAQEVRKGMDFDRNADYGFISPDGKFYRCGYGDHSATADRICYGQYETANPERYLEEHGWCKIYRPMQCTYGLYMNKNFRLTDAQLKKLQELKLDSIKGISDIL